MQRQVQELNMEKHDCFCVFKCDWSRKEEAERCLLHSNILSAAVITTQEISGQVFSVRSHQAKVSEGSTVTTFT